MDNKKIVSLLNKLTVTDFLLYTGELATCNYVLTANNADAQKILKEAGMTESEIQSNTSIKTINLYPFIAKHKIKFRPVKGFSIIE